MEEKKFEKFIAKAQQQLTPNQSALLAAEIIECAFIWRESEEGAKYWEDVCVKLHRKSWEIRGHKNGN